MSRPAKTFLIEAGSSRFRIDLRRTAEGYAVAAVLRSGPGKREGDFESFDPIGATMDVDWIRPLLKLKPRPASEVTILSDRVTTVVAEMPLTPGEDWRSNAEMEAQSISGLSSAESVASSTRLPSDSGMMCCWVVQVAMHEVAALRSAVGSASRSRLVSVGHPAGVRLDPAAPQLESWTEFVLFHLPKGERFEIRGWNGHDAMAEARRDGEVASILSEAGGRASLVVPGLAPPSLGEDAPRTVALGEDKGAKSWADALARACDPLTGSILGLPLVSVPKLPPSSKLLAAVSVGVAVVTLVILWGHHFLNQRIMQNHKDDLAELKVPAERMATANERIRELKKELKELGIEAENTEEPEVNVYAHRRRIGSLLNGIAVGSAIKEAVVLELKPDKQDTIIKGAATTFNAPQQLAMEIDRSLASNGWRASLTRRTAKLLRSDGGPWSFEIRLTPGRPVSVEALGGSGSNQSPVSR
ncbi:MAG: hypothetical protein AAGI48_03475 [Verrucomicrobiota bacterium]